MNAVKVSPMGLLLVLIILFSAGCKSSKKASEAAAAKARLEQELAQKKQLEEEQKLREAREREREAEERRLSVKEPSIEPLSNEVKLEKYFAAIATSPNVTSANSSIDEALTLFASPSVPVLIVISAEDGGKDYDRPTTIKDYLNYLKDQKKNINQVSDLKTDASGKIIEVELKKNL